MSGPKMTRLRSPRDPVKGVGQLQQPGGSKLRTTSNFSFERTHRAGGVHPAAVFADVPYRSWLIVELTKAGR